MDVRVSQAADVAYIKLGTALPAKGRSREGAPGVILDFDDAGDAVGIEILGPERRGMHAGTVRVHVDTDPGDLLPEDHPLVQELHGAGALDEGPRVATA